MTHSSLGLPDSWSLHSVVTPHNMTNASIWEDIHDQAASRISIGTFMAARTEALGSLDVTDTDRVSCMSGIFSSFEGFVWYQN